ncbi:amino acid ABC transporter permease [Ruminococcaceae bacterium OttesenSCG-928-I18]|nr:amino acid ABC transporter permease [Ruminococcaceae bacterium OttesenSCG-928-I18]
MELDYIMGIMPALIDGTKETLKIFCFTLLFALPLALPISMSAISRFWPLKALAKIYIWVFRGTPLMLQIFFFFYCLPMLTPIKLDRLSTAIFTFVLNYAAYFAEIYRGGIESIDRGQREAAKSLGFSRWQTMYLIIIPQAVRRVIPPVSNEVITLIKDTALVYVIGVPELMKAAKDANNRDVDPTAYFIAALIYLALTFILTMISRQLERRYSRHERKDAV